MIAHIVLVLSLFQVSTDVTDSQKREFFELLDRLPRDGEFYTEEGIRKAAPYLPILLALTEKDLERYDIYPFLALSRGLCNQKDERNYAVRNFSHIRHTMLKLGWAAMLFDANSASDEIVQFLKAALENETQAKLLSEMVGPKFEDFKRRLTSQPASKK